MSTSRRHHPTDEDVEYRGLEVLRTRRAAKAGTWYNDNPEQLDRQIKRLLDEVPAHSRDGTEFPVKDLRVIIAPHAGYQYCGKVMAKAYRCIDTEPVKNIFIIGPLHHLVMSQCLVGECYKYKTPFGILYHNLDIRDQMQSEGNFLILNQREEEREHSIEMHLPFIYKTFEHKLDQIKIVPFYVPSLSFLQEKMYGRYLSKFMRDPQNLFIISSDFCHWGSRFHYLYYSPDEDPRGVYDEWKIIYRNDISLSESIDRLDFLGMKIISKLNHEKFHEYLSESRNTICGKHCISIILACIGDLCSIKQKSEDILDLEDFCCRFIGYSKSNDVQSLDDESVSYGAGYITYTPFE